MKLQPGKKSTIQGNVILICVLFSFVLGITIASYMYLVKDQFTVTIRSHDWNTGMVLAEAGIEEGMAFINKYAGNYTNSQNWADTANADGWDNNGNVNGNVFHVQRTLDPTLGCYDVWVTNNITSISVCAVGSAFWNQQPVPNPQVPSAGAPGIATSGTDLGAIVRQVLVQATNDPLFSVAMASTGPINLNGFSLSVNSFDSGDLTHSNWNGGFGHGFRKADGFVATDGTILNVGGNTLIYGSVSTGPGGETNLMQGGSVGDANWVGVATPGIEPGHAEDDMNVVFQSVSPPLTLSQIGPFTNHITITNSGTFEYSENTGLSHGLTVAASNVVLYLPAGVDYDNSGYEQGDGYGQGYGSGSHHSITVTNGSAILYIDQNFDLGSSGNITNATGNATNLCLYGCSNLTSINLGSVPNFVGTIYAPQADLVLGNPNFPTVFTGSVIAKSITLNGNVQVYYDENLRRVGPTRAYVPVSWTEF